MQNSIKDRLNLLIIVLSVVPTLLIGSIMAWRIFQEEKVESIVSQHHSALHISTELNGFINAHMAQLDLLAKSKDLHTLSKDEQYQMLNGLLAGDHAYSEIRVLDADGMETIRISRLHVIDESELSNRAHTAEFGTPKSTAEPYFSPIWFDMDTGNPYMTVAVPFINLSTNRVTGVLAVDLDLHTMWQLMNDSHLSPFEQTYIIDERGRVVVHRNPSLVLRELTVPWPIDEATLQPGLGGPRMLRVVEPVYLGNQRLGVVVEDTMWYGLRLGFFSILLTLVIVFATMAVGLFVGRRALRVVLAPVDDLVQTAHKIAEGNYFLQADVSDAAPNELRILGTAFNQTTTSLLRSMGQLEDTVAELEESQAAISLSEGRYRALFESANDSIFIFDPESGRILDANYTAYTKLGYTYDELLKLTRETLDAGVVDDDNAEIVRRIRAGEGVQFRRMHRRKNGSLMPVEISSRLVETGEGNVVQSIVRDISDTIAAQQTLQDNLQFVETLLDTIPSPVFYKNTRGEYIGCNHAFAQIILGLPKEKIIGRTIVDLNPNIPPDLAEVYLQQDKIMFDAPGSQFYEASVLCADDIRRDFFFNKATFTNSDGEVAGIVGVMLDLSEIKQTEENLLRVNRLYRVLSRVNSAVLQFESRSALLTSICGILAEDGKFPLVWAGIYNSENHILEPLSVLGTHTEYLDDVQHIEITPDSPAKNCPAGRAFQRGETLAFNDLTDIPEFSKWSARAASFGLHSAAAIPVKLENHTLGTINLYSQIADFFNSDELKLLKEIEAAIAFGLSRHHQQQIQDVSLQVAEAAIVEDKLPDLFAAIHTSLGQLMPVNNFYIALYDDQTELLSFPYFVDERESAPPPPQKLNQGLTEYVIRSGEPLLASSEDFDTLVARGEVLSRGPGALDWMGVPLKISDRTLGVLAVQSYSMRNRFGPEELNILKFISSQIALAIQRMHTTDALRQQVQFNQLIYRTIQDGYLLFDVSGKILDVNEAYCTLLGYSAEELIGHMVWDIISDLSQEVVAQIMKTLLDGGATRFQDVQQRKDGVKRHFDVSAVLIETEGEKLIAAFHRDITEQREMLQRLEYRHQFEALVTTVSTRLANTPSPQIDDGLQQILQEIAEFTQADRSYIYLFTDDGKFINKTHEWCAEGIESQMAVMQNIPAADYPWWMHHLQRAENIHIPNAAELPDEAAYVRELLVSHNVQSLLGVPLTFTGKLVGFMGLDDVRSARTWAEEDILLLETVSDVIVGAIQRRQDEARILQRNQELGLLNDVITASITAQTAEDIFQVACEALTHTFGATQVVGGIFNDDFSEMEIVAETVGNPVASFIGRVFYPEHNPLIKNLLIDPGLLVIKNAQENSMMGELQEGFVRRQIEAIVMFPVSFSDKLFGGITMFYKKPLSLNEDEISLGQRVAGQVGAVLARFQLSRQQRHLITAIEQVRESIVITDTMGCIIYVNPYFEIASGYTEAEVLGKNPRFLKSGQQSNDFYADLWQKILKGEVWQGRIVNRRKDGELITEDMVISPVRNTAGDVVNFVAVKHDVTETLKLEEQYRQSQKMEAIGLLAGGIAHDFNNLLTAINGYAEMLMRQLPEGTDNREMVSNILGAGNRAAELTRQLLSFSRKTIIHPQLMNVNDAINNLTKMLRRIIGEDILLNLSLSVDLLPVKMDPSQVEQIILNLVVNARDAMPMGGEITIATQNVFFSDDEISPFAELKGGYYIRFLVSDTGEGIPPDIMEHIFEPFFTTKEVGKGTGFGLATVFGIVKQNGGDIRAYSELGSGASFSVYLPAVVEEDIAAELSMSDENAELPEGTELVLVVDDDEDVRLMSIMALQDQGYQVQEAESGAAALSWLATTSNVPELLLTDVIMPEMSGKTLAEHARELYPDLTVIYMSGYPENQISRYEVLDQEINFLQKPFLPTDLAKMVRRVLDGR